MKKHLFTALAMSAVCSLAHAGSISLDTRGDFESRNYNDAYNTRGYNRFDLQTLRVDAKGNFSDTTSFRLRFRLTKSTLDNGLGANGLKINQTDYTVFTKDNASDRLDFAYVQQKMGDNLSLQAGKFGTDIGGIEGITAGPDLYFNSAAYNEQQILRYATGAKLMYMMGDQEIDLMAVNQQTDAVVTTPTGAASPNGGTVPTSPTTTLPANFDQNHEAFGLVYKGSFMDKTLLPIVSYHTDAVQSTGVTGTSALDKKYDYYSAGLKYDFNPMFVELDYLLDNLKNKSVDGEMDTTTSVVGTFGYKWDNWVAKLKYEASQVQNATGVGANVKTKVNAYQLAAEYMPTGDKNLRYHVAYIGRDTKPDSSLPVSDTKTDQTVIVGFRILADFMK